MSGTLYVVGTPIGNLEDLSPRARRILAEAALVAAEDTRVTRKLLSHFEIHTPLTSYHAHSDPRKVTGIVDRLTAGEDVALVSDAGTPGVSDPGATLVSAAIAAGVTVVPIPGPSAAVVALSASGLDTAGFLFQGFLPRNRGDRRKTLAPLRALPHTLIFYEAPNRVAETLGALREELGDRPAAVARELTKKFEEIRRDQLSNLERRYRETAPRGECVILVSGATKPEEGASAESIDERLQALLAEGKSVRDAARVVAEEMDVPRRDAYARAMELRDAGETE